MKPSTLTLNLFHWYRTNGVGYADAVINELLSPEQKKELNEYIKTIEVENEKK